MDCSASYLNGCFRLLIYLFIPSITLLPTESVKSLSDILQGSELLVIFDSSLKTVAKMNANKTYEDILNFSLAEFTWGSEICNI